MESSNHRNHKAYYTELTELGDFTQTSHEGRVSALASQLCAGAFDHTGEGAAIADRERSHSMHAAPSHLNFDTLIDTQVRNVI